VTSGITRQTKLAVLPLFALATAWCAQPSETALDIDPVQTRVEFTLGDVLHTVHGTFRLKRGHIQFDPSTGRACGELVVDATSGESGSEGRDSRMHKNILESARFPEIVFRPDRIEGTVAPQGKSQVKLHGIFSIHGSDHEMTALADVDANQGQYEATVNFSVPYVKWGMKNPSTLILRVKDQVDITVHAVAKAVPAMATSN
jgi:polyisoprenoid-binding protein YceI